MTLRSDILKKSVTQSDHPTEAGRRGAVISYFFGSPLMQGLVSLPPDPPPYWSSARDGLLRATLHAENMWADAVYIALTKVSSLAWDTKGAVPLRVKRAQELLSLADDEMGWVQAIQKHCSDFLLTDNGAFLEVVRESSASGSKITGLIPLDSQRCIRTGDPDVPVIYRDRQQRYHEMKYWQVIMMADMPNSSETYWGVGFCAASRAYKAIRKLSALEAYVTEKITGQRPLSLNFVSNVSQQQIDDAVAAAKDQALSLGRSIYMGAVIIANIDPAAQAGVSSIDLAGLPDGFNANEERRNSQLAYANALGLDPQDINPELLASKALGTGAQSSVIDAKASGKGLVSYRQQLTHKLNWEVLDDQTWFYFHERDLRDEKSKADIDYVRAQANDLRIKNLSITPREARQIDVDNDLLPPEFMPKDFTPTTALSDTDKPVKAELQGAGGAPTYQPPNAAQVPEPNKPNPLKPTIAPPTAKDAKYEAYREKDDLILRFKSDPVIREKELAILGEISAQGNVLQQTLKEIQKGQTAVSAQGTRLDRTLQQVQRVETNVQKRFTSQAGVLISTLKQITDIQRAQARQRRENREAEKQLRLVSQKNQNQMLELARRVAHNHQDQAVIASRIVSKDEHGRPLRVRKEMGNGEMLDYQVIRDKAGHAERLELIKE